MENPFGHHHNHHHRRDDDDNEENRNQSYPPPDYQEPPFRGPPRPGPPREDYQDPPFRGPPRPGPPREDYQEPPFRGPPPRPGPPPLHYQEPQFEAPRPPPRPYQAEYEAPPPPTQVYHTSHRPEEFGSVSEESESHHSYKPHLPSFVHHVSHSSSGSELSNKLTVKVNCKAAPDFSLTIRDDKVILARSNPNDEFQHWYKDEKFSTRVKDSEGFPCFSLVNKATGQALKHSIGATQPVQLVPYNSDKLDQSILWTQSKDMSAGYRTIRMVNNIHLNVDAFHGDKKSGGVHEGTGIVLWEWNKGDNQLWKIVPY